MISPASPRRVPRAVTIFAIAAMVAGPPLEYLRYHHYPLLSPEVLLPTTLVKRDTCRPLLQHEAKTEGR